MARICRRQTQRSNVPADSPMEYFRRSLTFPFLDELREQLQSRFSDHQQVAARGLCLMPSAIKKDQASCKRSAVEFAKKFEDDLPDGQNLVTFEADLTHWCTLISQMDNTDVPSILQDTLVLANDSLLPTICRLLVLVATWPVTSNSCERSISSLRRLKTYLRSTMTQQRLCGLALLHSHYCVEVNAESVIRRFLELRPRAIVAPNLFSKESGEPETEEESSFEGDAGMDFDAY